MKTRNILCIAFAMLAALVISACHSDDDESKGYQPAHRSAIFNEVRLFLTDADGNNLVNSNETLGDISIYGNLSGKNAPFKVVEEDGLKYIKFNADLPDERRMDYGTDKAAGTSTMTLTVGRKKIRLVFAFEAENNDEVDGTMGRNAIRVTGVQFGDKVVTGSETDGLAIGIVVGDDGLDLTGDVPVPEEESVTGLYADVSLPEKEFLGSGYDVTGAYLSNECLRENVVDLSKMHKSAITRIAAYSGSGGLMSGVGNAWGFLDGLRKAQGFTMEGEPGDVYFCGTFTDNPLFKEAKERADDYSFMMYMDRYVVCSQKILLPNRNIESVLTDAFKQALAEESAERIVERFGTHVLKCALMGLNVQWLYRSGLKANTNDEDRFLCSMFRRMNEVCRPMYSGVAGQNPTKGGALAVWFHGGNTQRLAADLGAASMTQTETAAAIVDWWDSASEELDELSLALLSGDDLVPIYELVPDEAKRAEVQRAVKAYIHSHQLE